MLRSDSREFKSRLPKYTIRFSANATWLQLLKTLGVSAEQSFKYLTLNYFKFKIRMLFKSLHR